MKAVIIEAVRYGWIMRLHTDDTWPADTQKPVAVYTNLDDMLKDLPGWLQFDIKLIDNLPRTITGQYDPAL